MTRTARHHSTTGDELLSRAGRKVAFHLVGGRCPICRRRVNLGSSKLSGLQLDHVIACANGGGCVGNLIPMCGSCNASKCDRDLAAWLPARLVRCGRASTIRGARRMTSRTLTELTTVQTALTAALADAGIWA